MTPPLRVSLSNLLALLSAADWLTYSVVILIELVLVFEVGIREQDGQSLAVASETNDILVDLDWQSASEPVVEVT